MSEEHSWYRTTHDFGGERTLFETVVDALSAVENVEPLDLDLNINEVVDPDALNHLFRPKLDGTPRKGNGYVEFTEHGRRIVVYSDGEILIDPAH